MKCCHSIGLDTHGKFCVIAVVNQQGEVIARSECATNIPALLGLHPRLPLPVSGHVLDSVLVQ
jgi:predicted NBD/HSP70 family sugar kinase